MGFLFESQNLWFQINSILKYSMINLYLVLVKSYHKIGLMIVFQNQPKIVLYCLPFPLDSSTFQRRSLMFNYSFIL